MILLLGFDPGGIKRFGWATLQVGATGAIVNVTAGVTSTAAHAIDSARDCAASIPAGIGIDAPLYWVQHGDRRADSYIRKRFVAAGGHSGTVSAVNSLRGACLMTRLLVRFQPGQPWLRNQLGTTVCLKKRVRSSLLARTFRMGSRDDGGLQHPGVAQFVSRRDASRQQPSPR
jgi:Protein of unknown function (DUF429)